MLQWRNVGSISGAGARSGLFGLGRPQTFLYSGRGASSQMRRLLDTAAYRSGDSSSSVRRVLSMSQLKTQSWKPQHQHGNRREVEALTELASLQKREHRVRSNVLDREMAWLQDPRELANRVARLLAFKSESAAMAVDMVRRAQRDGMECTAAWNRLMAHCMRKGAPLAAFKFYNDMKKRGRRPNDHTYTIMLKGFCHPTPQDSMLKPVPTAYSIYKSIPQPTVIHHNVMLEVCGSRYDMDTLWQVVGDLPEEGPNAPDSTTYTVILLAIRRALERDVDRVVEGPIQERRAARAGHVRDAKRVWADVIRQWRNGKLNLDTHLVGTMSQVLMDPLDERGCYEALAVFNQTMGLPIIAKMPEEVDSAAEQGLWESRFFDGIRGRRIRSEDARNAMFDDTMGPDGDRAPSEEDTADAQQSVETGEPEENFEGLFDPVVGTNSAGNKSKSPGPVFLRLDNAGLNFILTTTRLMTQGTGIAKEYWDLVNQKDNANYLTPDAGNFHEYLRILRVGRSSRLAVAVIRDQMIPANAVEPKSFHIAMSTCLRDRQNPNVLKNAGELLALMDQNLPLPDPRPLSSYLGLVEVLIKNPQWLLTLDDMADFKKMKSDLGSMGRRLKLALQVKAFSTVLPHVSKLCEAMERDPRAYQPRERKSVGTVDGSVNGFLALTFLAQARTWLDKLLGPEYEGMMAPTERDSIASWARNLRKYSKPEIVVKFEKSTLIPTPQQYTAVYGKEPTRRTPSNDLLDSAPEVRHVRGEEELVEIPASSDARGTLLQ